MPSSKPVKSPSPPAVTAPQQRRDAGETTPLLTAGRNGDEEAPAFTENGTVKTAAADKPLPKAQILLLCYARMMEPIAFFCIFPYIGPMLERVGHLPTSDVGFYSGLIESVFSATQVLVLLAWGRLADRLGRKPVLVASLVGMVAGPALFGLARSVGQMVAARCLAGVFSGSGLIIRTMVGDHSTPKTQALAFSWFAFAGNIGIFLGPLVGGLLADPAAQYPGLFGGIGFFRDYPYALPGFAVSAISATAAVTSALFVEETLARTEPGSSRSDGTQGSAETPQAMSIWQLLKAPGVSIVLWVYGHVMFLAFAFTAIMPIALFTPVALGGIGCTTFQITLYMAAQGASQALWLLLVFPKLQKRVGTKGILRISAAAYPVFFAGYILMNALLRSGSQAAMAWFWIVGPIVVFVGPGVSMAFTGIQLALNDVSPTPHVLGTLNALAMTYMSAIRSFVPGVATAIYAVGVRNQILAGQLAFVVLIPIAAALTVVLRWLPNDKT